MLLVLTKNKINVTIISRGHMLSDRHVMKGMTMSRMVLCLVLNISSLGASTLTDRY